VFATLDGSGKPAVAPTEWNNICQAPFAAIQAVGTAALDQAIARADAMQADARFNLILQAVVLLGVIAAALIGTLVIRGRFIGPVARLMRALERLREAAAAAERLAAEQEAARAQQLARAQALDALCGRFDQAAQGGLASLT